MEENEGKVQEYTPEKKVEVYTPKNSEPAKQNGNGSNGNGNGSHTQVYEIVTGKDPSWQDCPRRSTRTADDQFCNRYQYGCSQKTDVVSSLGPATGSRDS